MNQITSWVSVSVSWEWFQLRLPPRRYVHWLCVVSSKKMKVYINDRILLKFIFLLCFVFSLIHSSFLVIVLFFYNMYILLKNEESDVNTLIMDIVLWKESWNYICKSVIAHQNEGIGRRIILILLNTDTVHIIFPHIS